MINEYWLLIFTTFNKSVFQNTTKKVQIRNQLMLDLADEVVVAYASEKGKLRELIDKDYLKMKKLAFLD
ncbi:MAG TPA: hypothetical protein ENN22_12695 [bacterium]|nr:hypothetical protein [bacterium]